MLARALSLIISFFSSLIFSSAIIYSFCICCLTLLLDYNSPHAVAHPCSFFYLRFSCMISFFCPFVRVLFWNFWLQLFVPDQNVEGSVEIAACTSGVTLAKCQVASSRAVPRNIIGPKFSALVLCPPCLRAPTPQFGA